MKHYASPDFWACYNAMPQAIRDVADQAFKFLKQDPGTHRFASRIRRFWSVRVGSHHRALAIEAPDGLTGFWIGSHADYDKLLA